MKPATVGFCLLMGAFLMSNPASAAERQHFDLVVALDISKSLSPAQLEQAASKLGEILEGLPPKIEFGIVTFADEARWLRPVAPPGSGSRANAALVGLEREGSFTVLYDALFQSAADLAGGVVLLVGDGVDEQSAVLHEDVVRRFEANSVRVVSVATGRAVDERALRRLAMLTGGAYLGALDDLEPPQVAAYLEKATLKPPPEVVEVPAPTPGAGVDDAKISALIARIDALEKREAEMRAQLEQANAYLDTLPARDSIPLPIERSGDLSVPPPPIQQAQAVDDQELLPPPVENLGNLLDDAVRKGDFDRSIEIPGTDISLRVGGRFKLDANVGKVDGGDSESNLGANASRVSVFAQKPTDFGRAGGFLEADFAGGRARIRHGYAQLGPVLAGLTWSNFSHLAALPSTVAVDPVGTVARRVPQLRWSWTGDEREFALALENASPDLALGVDDRARRKLPDLTGHVRFTRPASDVQVGGILRTLEYDGPGRSGDATGWGISLSASLPNGETDRAVLGALYGEGIGSYVIGLSGSLVDAVVTAEGGLRAIEAYGGYLGYEHRWSGEWRSTFMASYVERERDSLLDSIRAATSATLNVIWNPFPGFGVGAELLLGREEDAFGVERDERRLFLAVQYGF